MEKFRKEMVFYKTNILSLVKMNAAMVHFIDDEIHYFSKLNEEFKKNNIHFYNPNIAINKKKRIKNLLDLQDC